MLNRIHFLTLLFLFFHGLAIASMEPFQAEVKGWTKIERPIPGVQSTFYPKVIKQSDTGFQASVNVVHDSTATLYTDIDSYAKDALKVLLEQKTHKIHSIKTRQSRSAGKYYMVHSSSSGRMLLQGMFFKPGFGFYVVTGSSSEKEYPKFFKTFESAIRGAKFL